MRNRILMAVMSAAAFVATWCFLEIKEPDEQQS